MDFVSYSNIDAITDAINSKIDTKQDILEQGDNIIIDGNRISAEIDFSKVQKKLIPGEGITLDDEGNISSENSVYKDGNFITIGDDNSINLDSHQKVRSRNVVSRNPYPNVTDTSYTSAVSLFDYDIDCELSDDTIKVGNLSDNIEEVNWDTEFKWIKDEVSESSKYACIFHTNGVAVNAIIKLSIYNKDADDTTNHYVVITTKPVLSETAKTTFVFNYMTTTNWNFGGFIMGGSRTWKDSDGKSTNSLTDLDLFLEVPAQFVGYVSAKIVRFQVAEISETSDNYSKAIKRTSAISGDYTMHFWAPAAGGTSSAAMILFDNDITKEWTDQIDGVKDAYGNTGGKIHVNVIADFGEDLKAGDVLNDIIIMDYQIHLLESNLATARAELNVAGLTDEQLEDIEQMLKVE